MQSSLKSVCLAIIVASGVVLGGCATRGAGAPPPPQQGAGTTGPDGTVIAAPAPEPARPDGFLRRLSNSLGGDSNQPNVGPCPATRVLYDASRFVELTGPARFDNVGFTGEINGVRSQCRYLRANPISLSLEIDAAYGRGPKAAGERSKTVTFWVAVTQVIRSTDPVTGQARVLDIGPLARERFSTVVTFPEGADRIAQSTQTIHVTIPRAQANTSGENFEVIVGFDLTDEQLQMNRDGIRFRIDAGPNEN